MTHKTSASRRKPIAAGQRYGRLVAVEFVDQDRWRAALWRFRCDCGKDDYVARPDQVRRGMILSCGCLRDERAAERTRMRIKHGHSRKGSRSPEYVSWGNMLDRCYDQTSGSYEWYGKIGVTVCDRWRESFVAFLTDMGPKPARGCTIGRFRNDGNYEPGNCRWESAKQQARNKRNSRLVMFHGRQITIAEACEITGIPRGVVDARLRLGWAPEAAVSEPVKFHKPRKP